MNQIQRIPNGRLLQTSLFAICLTTGLGACGGKGEKAETAQIAAQVGSSHVLVNQINQVLSSAPLPNVSEAATLAARKQVLERLIDQQLAVDEATKARLQDAPVVMAKLEAARQEVLARAYLEQITAQLAQPGAAEISTYYQAHPALFAERRVFNLQEIRVPKAAEVIVELQKMAEQGRPMEDVADFLRARETAFGGGSATRPAEQIPLELLPRVHALKDGQSTVIQAGESLTYLRVASSQQLPVSEAVAAPDIEKHLNNQRSAAAVSAEFKRLRESTPITYLGDFKRAAAQPSTASTRP